MEQVGVENAGTPAKKLAESLTGSSDVTRSPLKDVSNRNFAEVTLNGSVNPGDKTIVEAFVDDSSTCGSKSETESPASSTPSRLDTTTDDYESADEGPSSPTRDVDLSMLATQLETLNLGTPSKPVSARPGVVFPYSPLSEDDSILSNSSFVDASFEKTFTESPIPEDGGPRKSLSPEVVRENISEKGSQEQVFKVPDAVPITSPNTSSSTNKTFWSPFHDHNNTIVENDGFNKSGSPSCVESQPESAETPTQSESVKYPNDERVPLLRSDDVTVSPIVQDGSPHQSSSPKMSGCDNPQNSTQEDHVFKVPDGFSVRHRPSIDVSFSTCKSDDSFVSTASSFWSPSHDRNNLTVKNQEDLNQSEFHNVDASAEKSITESLISQDGSPQKSLSLPETAEAPTQSESAKTPSLSDSASLESKAGVLSKEEPILKDVHRKSIVFEGPAVAKSPLSGSTASTDSEYSPLATPIRKIGDGVVNESITPTQVDVNHATPSQVGDGQVNSSCKKDILLASEDAEDELIPDSGSSGGLTELEIAGEVVDSCISAATSSIILNGADSGDSNVSHSNSGSAVTVSESCAHSSSNDVAVESVDSSCTDSTINEEPECKSSTAGKVHQEVIQTSEEGTESVPPKDLNVKSSEQPDVTIAGNAIEQEACAIPNGNTMLTEELSGTAAPNHAGQSSQPSPDGSEVHVNVEGEKKEAVNVQDPDKLEVEVSQSGAESAVQVCISDEARSCEDLVAENKNFSISSISNEANSEPVLSTIDDSVVPPKSIEEVQKFEDDAVSTSELPEVPSIDSNVKSLNSSEQAHVTLAENAAIIPNDTAMHNDQSEVKSDMTATNQAEQSCQIVTTPEIETVIESDVSQFDPESVVQVSDTHDAPSFKKNPVEESQDSTCASSESVLSTIDESKSTLESLEGAQKTVSVDESQLPGLVLPNDSSIESMCEMNHVADDGNVAIQVATESISNGTIVLGVQTDVVSPVEVTPSEAQSAVQGCDSHQESSAEEDLSAQSKDSSNESATLNVVHSQPNLDTIEGSVPFRKSPEQAQTSEEVISQLPESVVTEDSNVKSRSDVPQAGNDIAEEVSRTTIPNVTLTLADQAKTVHESLSGITAPTPTENSSKILPSPVGSEVSNVTEHAKETKQGSVAVEVEFGKPASMGESFVVTKNDSQLPKMETKAGPIESIKLDFSRLPGSSKEETEELNLEIKSFHLSPENIDKAMDQSYKDISQILATCSKQEQELVGQIDFSCIQAEAARIASDLNLANEAKLPGQSNKQPMMQSSLLSAETNNSEAGPVTADEDFNNEEFFKDVIDQDFELLAKAGSKSLHPSKLSRQSLYVKFDPLVGQIIASSEESDNSLLAAMADNHLSSGEEGKLNTTPPSHSESDDRIIQITPTSSRKEISQGVYTPILRQEISKLQELMIQQDQAHQEKADLIEQLRSRIAQLEMSNSPTGSDSRTLEKELEAKEYENKQLHEELEKSKLSNKQLVQVMEEYEKTISQLVAIKEETKAQMEKDKETIGAERDTALQHLSNMEVAFNDIHQKYERAKTVIETLHANEKELKKSYDAVVETVEAQNTAYQRLKQHAAEKLSAANAEIEKIHKEYNGEMARMKAVAKKNELKCKSLEESLEQKKNELRELTQICDELIGKVTGKPYD